jgi:hypothetical protein
MTTNIADILTVAAPLGISAFILSILAWRSPQLIRELFAGVRGLVNDARKASTKRPRKESQDMTN